jgi:hypothetical protein
MGLFRFRLLLVKFKVHRTGGMPWHVRLRFALSRRAAHRDWLPRTRPPTNHFSGLRIFCFAGLAFRFGCAIGFLEAGRKRLCLLS